MKCGISKFPFIREEARFGGTGLSERELRLMLAQGRLPGFYIGEKKKYFRVNHDALVDYLNSISASVSNQDIARRTDEEHAL